MPLQKKLKTAENGDDHSDSEESMNSEDMSESGDSQGDGEEIMIDFVARALVESDLESIQLLMQQKLGSFAVSLSEIATILVQQDNIGNVIYQAPENEEEHNEDDETIFGVISCINFGSEQAKKFVDNFKQFLIKECQKHNNGEVLKKFEEILRTKKISYLVNERYMNIPAAISVPMFESLVNDIESEKDGNNNNANSDYWMLITKHYSEKTETETNLIYNNAEEQTLEEFSDLKFEIRSGAKKTHRNEFNNEMTQVINVVLVPFENVGKCIEKIKELAAK